LRVGFLPDSLPYAFVNQRGDLVGLDIELAHRLAAELHVGLELVPVARDRLAEFVHDGRCDLVMSGVALTTSRAAQMLFSASYLDETLGLLVPDHDRERFESWRTVAATDGLTIGVPNESYFTEQMRALAPAATLRAFGSADDVFAAAPGSFDAVLLPAERGSAWTLLHPQFSMVVPAGGLINVPLAYPVARQDSQWATFLNTWIELKRKDGTLRALTQYWIHGQDAAPPRPRWSIGRDVLHWLS
jgi:ABC-type amino acid transport substrate-binding protein